MKRLISSTLFLLTVAGAGQVQAADDPTLSAPAAPVAKPDVSAASRLDPNQTVCKRMDVTGSHLGGDKVCHTRQEWADMAAASRNKTDTIQQNTNLTRNLGH